MNSLKRQKYRKDSMSCNQTPSYSIANPENCSQAALPAPIIPHSPSYVTNSYILPPFPLFRKSTYQQQYYTEIVSPDYPPQVICKKNIIFRLGLYNSLSSFAGNLTNTFETVSTDWKELNISVGCNCRRSACHKRYCTCFNTGRPCDDTCSCSSCENSILVPQYRQYEDPLYLYFSSTKISSYATQPIEGCNCKMNTSCLKRYCYCKKRGINCGKDCVCFNCYN